MIQDSGIQKIRVTWDWNAMKDQIRVTCFGWRRPHQPCSPFLVTNVLLPTRRSQVLLYSCQSTQGCGLVRI